MRVGITGSYASGKGTVTAILEKLGATAIDTDTIAREITAPGMPVYNQIIETFGTEFTVPDGNINRRALARHVFSNSLLTTQLNNITHPAILEETMHRSRGEGIFCINVPLLFESGFNKIMNVTVLITIPEEMSILRGMERDGLTREEIILRLNHQMTLKEKEKYADYIIDNSGTLENTHGQVMKLWNTLKEMNVQ